MAWVAYLDRNHVKSTQRVEQEDQPQNDPNNLERLALDEHAHNVINNIEDESRDEE